MDLTLDLNSVVKMSEWVIWKPHYIHMAPYVARVVSVTPNGRLRLECRGRLFPGVSMSEAKAVLPTIHRTVHPKWVTNERDWDGR